MNTSSPAPAKRALLHGPQAFAAVLVGQLVSTIGSGITRFGLGFWVYSQTQDAAAYSTLLFFAVLPLGLGSLVAGPLVDRFDRRRVMIVANIAASASTLGVLLLYRNDALALWHLYVALTVNGLANAFILPAFESSVPLLLPKHQLGRAAGLAGLISGLEVVLAPTLAGVLLNRTTLATIFTIDFMGLAASLLALGLVVLPRPARTDGPQRTLWQSFLDGLAVVRGQQATRVLMGVIVLLMFLLPGLVYASITPLVMSFADEAAAGVVISGFGVGALVGSILLSAWGGPPRRMTGLLMGVGLAGVAVSALALRANVLWLAGALTIVGAGFVFAFGLNRVIWQVKIDPVLLGRVFSLRVALGVGAQSIGVLIAGRLAQRVFEPLMMPGGALAPVLGPLIGVGPGRGIALMLLLIGVVLVLVALGGLVAPMVHRLEDTLPDHEIVKAKVEVPG